MLPFGSSKSWLLPSVGMESNQETRHSVEESIREELPRNSLSRHISSHSLVSEHYDDADVYERFLNV